MQRWDWLGEHLAVDVANTVRRRGMEYVDLLDGPDALVEWIEHEAHRLPAGSAAPVTSADLERYREVRDHVLALLRAGARGAPLPAASVAAVNAEVLGSPTVRLLGPDVGTSSVQVLRPGRAVDGVVAVVAAATVDLLTGPDVAGVALCDAPSCGQLYHRDRPNQSWCDPSCGNRARAARHHRRRAGAEVADGMAG